jgi:proteasome accessory factor C
MTRTPTEQAATRLSRLLSLVPWLMTNDGVSLHDAADHFGISVKQLRADLDLLIVSGRPGYMHGDLLDIQYWDDDGRIHVLDPQTLTRPMALSPTEAGALLIAMRMLAQLPGSKDSDALISAIDKLETATGVHEVAIVEVAGSGQQFFEAIHGAIESGVQVRLGYASAATDSATVRVVDPHALTVASGHVYLQAWCTQSEAIRTFRLDRVLSCEVLETPVHAARRAAAVPPPYLPSVVREISLEVSPQLAWLGDQDFARVEQDRPDGSRLVILNVGDDDWLLRLLLRVGAHARIINDDPLVEMLHERAKATLGLYAGDQ